MIKLMKTYLYIRCKGHETHIHTQTVIETPRVNASTNGFLPLPQRLVTDKPGGRRSGFLTLIRTSLESHRADWDLSKHGGQGM